MEHNNENLLETNLDQAYWNKRWEKNETGWDIGYPSPSIVHYMDDYPNKKASILIPGCGNGYEAEYLVSKGFQQITLVDIAPLAVENLKKKYAHIPQIHVICADFFHLEGQFDLMIEQTFFCALSPSLRSTYVAKTASLLKEKGKLIGLLFNREFGNEFPPFGGNEQQYRNLFEPYFHIRKMENCYNSILPRANSELFIHLIKK